MAAGSKVARQLQQRVADAPLRVVRPLIGDALQRIRSAARLQRQQQPAHAEQLQRLQPARDVQPAAVAAANTGAPGAAGSSADATAAGSSAAKAVGAPDAADAAQAARVLPPPCQLATADLRLVRAATGPPPAPPSSPALSPLAGALSPERRPVQQQDAAEADLLAAVQAAAAGPAELLADRPQAAEAAASEHDATAAAAAATVSAAAPVPQVNEVHDHKSAMKQPHHRSSGGSPPAQPQRPGAISSGGLSSRHPPQAAKPTHRGTKLQVRLLDAGDAAPMSTLPPALGADPAEAPSAKPPATPMPTAAGAAAPSEQQPGTLVPKAMGAAAAAARAVSAARGAIGTDTALEVAAADTAQLPAQRPPPLVQPPKFAVSSGTSEQSPPLAGGSGCLRAAGWVRRWVTTEMGAVRCRSRI